MSSSKLTEDEIREKRRQYQKMYREKTKEKRKEYSKQYFQHNKKHLEMKRKKNYYLKKLRENASYVAQIKTMYKYSDDEIKQKLNEYLNIVF